MSLDPLVLSRIQFAWVMGWHFLLPAFTVGLASFIAVLEGLNLFTGREIYLRISSFWIKIFAVSFGMGVVSGIVMPFQMRGTNWSRYSDAAADIVGPLLTRTRAWSHSSWKRRSLACCCSDVSLCRRGPTSSQR